MVKGYFRGHKGHFRGHFVKRVLLCQLCIDGSCKECECFIDGHCCSYKWRVPPGCSLDIYAYKRED